MKVTRTATIKLTCSNDENPSSCGEININIEFEPAIKRDTKTTVGGIVTELLHALKGVREPDEERGPDEQKAEMTERLEA